MDTMLQIALSNAAVATGLALVAAVAGLLWRRRPALVHGLWLLVLLKLLTPPLVRVPVPDLRRASAESANAPATVRTEQASPEATATHPASTAAEEPLAVELVDRTPENAYASGQNDSGSPPLVTAPMEAAPTPSNEWATTRAMNLPDWRTTLLTVWIAGATGWFLLAGLRLARFRRLLRFARPAPADLQREADRIATALGMRWAPVVELLPGRLAPMVWTGAGTPRLLLPDELVGQLEPEAAATLMAHELAHLRRGDHCVRLVEFLALGLFWWHPVVWVARKALREAEEQCCDAWVVSTLAGAGKTYATALVETLDFLSAGTVTPPLACGIGRVSDLKRRLTMIMRGTTPRSLCWREVLAVLGLATLLPMLPTLARADSDDQQPPTRTRTRTEERRVRAFVTDDSDAKDAKDDKGPGVEAARSELKALEADLQKKLAEVREASQKLKQAAEKIHRVEIERAREMAKETGKDIKEKVHREIMLQLDGKDGKRQIILDGKDIGSDSKKMILSGPVEIQITADGKTLIRRLDGDKGTAIAVPAVPAIPPVPAIPGVKGVPPVNPEAIRSAVESAMRAAGASPRRSDGSREGDRRIEQLEKRLDAVMRELESLRREKGEPQRKVKDKDKKPSRGNSEEQDDSL
jgi:beta-lactamase regulating signal transducer with metallopeptidase domain